MKKRYKDEISSCIECLLCARCCCSRLLRILLSSGETRYCVQGRGSRQDALGTYKWTSPVWEVRKALNIWAKIQMGETIGVSQGRSLEKLSAHPVEGTDLTRQPDFLKKHKRIQRWWNGGGWVGSMERQEG